MTAGWNLVDVVPNGAALYRGKYSVTGDKITFSNVEEKWIAYDDRTTSYDWQTSDNLEATYEFTDAGLWIDLKTWVVSREYFPAGGQMSVASEQPPPSSNTSLVGTWTSNGKQLHYRLVDGQWVLNEGGEQGFGYGYIFNSDGTYIFMMALSDIAGQYLGTGIYSGIYSTDGGKLILSVRQYDFVSRNRDKDTSSEKTADDEIYYFSFGIKYTGWGEGLILQPEDMSVSDTFFFPLK